jgi:Lar family restriction alleviation protein
LIPNDNPALSRQTQNLPVATPSRFDSGLRHQQNQGLAAHAGYSLTCVFAKRFPQRRKASFLNGASRPPMKEEEMEELKPCPFCGSDELSHGHTFPPHQGEVQCHNCDALIFAGNEAAAIAKWNRRALSPPPKEQE